MFSSYAGLFLGVRGKGGKGGVFRLFFAREVE